MAIDEGRGALWRVIRAHVGREDVSAGEIVVTVAAAVGGLYMGAFVPDAAMRTVPVAAGLVGVIIGAIIAAIGLVSAFFDQSLLRKLALIEQSPQRPLAPFLVTVVFGVVSAFGLALVVALGPGAPSPILGAVCLIAFGSAAATVASLIPALDVLVQFVGVKSDASVIDDDVLRELTQGHSDGEDGDEEDNHENKK
jgi:hypothetical protein